MVDEVPRHVIHLHVNPAGEVLEMECHLAIVGVGRYSKGPACRKAVFYAVERAHEPISA